MELQSTLTCPHCGHSSKETMPTDACRFFYDCPDAGFIGVAQCVRDRTSRHTIFFRQRCA